VKPGYLHKKLIRQFIRTALAEDVGDGDHSSIASIPRKARQKAKLIVKSEGILAGVEMAKQIFKQVDTQLKVHVFLRDGSTVKPGDIAFEVHGHARSILTAERLVLNCMQRMSAIATLTQSYAKQIEGTGAQLLDTRKTTPNFRIAEKWAVLIGGGSNHRFGLYDMIILKDNHIDFAGGIPQAIHHTHKYLKKLGKRLKVEVETRNLEEVKQVLEQGKVHRIMLDNMSTQMMREAVKLINKTVETEASGGINLQNIREVALTGVDYISVGALTHSAGSMDMSLKAFD
jgi:nicotinate-nucleotide pyrophosphorylase (carboxylating)